MYLAQAEVRFYIERDPFFQVEELGGGLQFDLEMLPHGGKNDLSDELESKFYSQLPFAQAPKKEQNSLFEPAGLEPPFFDQSTSMLRGPHQGRQEPFEEQHVSAHLVDLCVPKEKEPLFETGPPDEMPWFSIYQGQISSQPNQHVQQQTSMLHESLWPRTDSQINPYAASNFGLSVKCLPSSNLLQSPTVQHSVNNVPMQWQAEQQKPLADQGQLSCQLQQVPSYHVDASETSSLIELQPKTQCKVGIENNAEVSVSLEEDQEMIFHQAELHRDSETSGVQKYLEDKNKTEEAHATRQLFQGKEQQDSCEEPIEDSHSLSQESGLQPTMEAPRPSLQIQQDYETTQPKMDSPAPQSAPRLSPQQTLASRDEDAEMDPKRPIDEKTPTTLIAGGARQRQPVGTSSTKQSALVRKQSERRRKLIEQAPYVARDVSTHDWLHLLELSNGKVDAFSLLNINFYWYLIDVIHFNKQNVLPTSTETIDQLRSANYAFNDVRGAEPSAELKSLTAQNEVEELPWETHLQEDRLAHMRSYQYWMAADEASCQKGDLSDLIKKLESEYSGIQTDLDLTQMRLAESIKIIDQTVSAPNNFKDLNESKLVGQMSPSAQQAQIGKELSHSKEGTQILQNPEMLDFEAPSQKPNAQARQHKQSRRLMTTQFMQSASLVQSSLHLSKTQQDYFDYQRNKQGEANRQVTAARNLSKSLGGALTTNRIAFDSCVVCTSDEYDADNVQLQCKMCEAYVHMKCVGIESATLRQTFNDELGQLQPSWCCATCSISVHLTQLADRLDLPESVCADEELEFTPDCIFCGLTGGSIMRPSNQVQREVRRTPGCAGATWTSNQTVGMTLSGITRKERDYQARLLTLRHKDGVDISSFPSTFVYWCHMSCAFWLPQVQFQERRPIQLKQMGLPVDCDEQGSSGLESDSMCYLCGQNTGLIVRCSHDSPPTEMLEQLLVDHSPSVPDDSIVSCEPVKSEIVGCENSVHAECARRADLEQIYNPQTETYKIFCQNHRPLASDIELKSAFWEKIDSICTFVEAYSQFTRKNADVIKRSQAIRSKERAPESQSNAKHQSVCGVDDNLDSDKTYWSDAQVQSLLAQVQEHYFAHDTVVNIIQSGTAPKQHPARKFDYRLILAQKNREGFSWDKIQVDNFSFAACFEKYWDKVGPSELEFKRQVLGSGPRRETNIQKYTVIEKAIQRNERGSQRQDRRLTRASKQIVNKKKQSQNFTSKLSLEGKPRQRKRPSRRVHLLNQKTEVASKPTSAGKRRAEKAQQKSDQLLSGLLESQPSTKTIKQNALSLEEAQAYQGCPSGSSQQSPGDPNYTSAIQMTQQLHYLANNASVQQMQLGQPECNPDFLLNRLVPHPGLYEYSTGGQVYSVASAQAFGGQSSADSFAQDQLAQYREMEQSQWPGLQASQSSCCYCRCSISQIKFEQDSYRQTKLLLQQAQLQQNTEQIVEELKRRLISFSVEAGGKRSSKSGIITCTKRLDCKGGNFFHVRCVQQKNPTFDLRKKSRDKWYCSSCKPAMGNEPHELVGGQVSFFAPSPIETPDLSIGIQLPLPDTAKFQRYAAPSQFTQPLPLQQPEMFPKFQPPILRLEAMHGGADARFDSTIQLNIRSLSRSIQQEQPYAQSPLKTGQESSKFSSKLRNVVIPPAPLQDPFNAQQYSSKQTSQLGATVDSPLPRSSVTLLALVYQCKETTRDPQSSKQAAGPASGYGAPELPILANDQSQAFSSQKIKPSQTLSLQGKSELTRRVTGESPERFVIRIPFPKK